VLLKLNTTQHDDGSSEVRHGSHTKRAIEILIQATRRHFMVTTKFRTVASTALAVSVLLITASMALSQTTSTTTSTSSARTVTSGQKMKVKGVVVRRDADTFIVRDANGVDTTVRLSDTTSVKTNGGFLRSGSNYAQTNILRGLNLEVEGRGNAGGELAAEKVRFSESDMRVARSVESRAAPLEERASTTETKLTQVEENAQRLSGQLDELAAVANTAKGGAKAAQDTADAAVAGVNETNERISALDDYVPQTTTAVNFKVNSAVLSPDAKTKLDELATRALNTKGYVIEVSGYTDSTGSLQKNRVLSQNRADAVIRYLVENHQIPLRRVVTPYGYGKTNPVADNTTREGREQNRRVEIKLLVNKGLTAPAPTIKTTTGTE
jgi:OmpA-OmpF porin, OOP family